MSKQAWAFVCAGALVRAKVACDGDLVAAVMAAEPDAVQELLRRLYLAYCLQRGSAAGSPGRGHAQGGFAAASPRTPGPPAGSGSTTGSPGLGHGHAGYVTPTLDLGSGQGSPWLPSSPSATMSAPVTLNVGQGFITPAHDLGTGWLPGSPGCGAAVPAPVACESPKLGSPARGWGPSTRVRRALFPPAKDCPALAALADTLGCLSSTRALHTSASGTAELPGRSADADPMARISTAAPLHQAEFPVAAQCHETSRATGDATDSATWCSSAPSQRRNAPAVVAAHASEMVSTTACTAQTGQAPFPSNGCASDSSTSTCSRIMKPDPKPSYMSASSAPLAALLPRAHRPAHAYSSGAWAKQSARPCETLACRCSCNDKVCLAGGLREPLRVLCSTLAPTAAFARAAHADAHICEKVAREMRELGALATAAPAAPAGAKKRAAPAAVAGAAVTARGGGSKEGAGPAAVLAAVEPARSGGSVHMGGRGALRAENPGWAAGEAPSLDNKSAGVNSSEHAGGRAVPGAAHPGGVADVAPSTICTHGGVGDGAHAVGRRSRGAADPGWAAGEAPSRDADAAGAGSSEHVGGTGVLSAAEESSRKAERGDEGGGVHVGGRRVRKGAKGRWARKATAAAALAAAAALLAVWAAKKPLATPLTYRTPLESADPAAPAVLVESLLRPTQDSYEPQEMPPGHLQEAGQRSGDLSGAQGKSSADVGLAGGAAPGVPGPGLPDVLTAAPEHAVGAERAIVASHGTRQLPDVILEAAQLGGPAEYASAANCGGEQPTEVTACSTSRHVMKQNGVPAGQLAPEVTDSCAAPEAAKLQYTEGMASPRTRPGTAELAMHADYEVRRQGVVLFVLVNH